VRAFVTGGSGYVGRNLIRNLKKRGDEVVALVRSPKSAEVVQALGARAAMGDLDDGASMQTGMAGCEVVYHCAAEVSEWGTREQFLKVNVLGTWNALQAAKAAGVKTFVHVGTEAAFCDGSPLVNLDESRPLPAKPLPRYPETKAQAERLVRAAASPQLRTVVVRPRLIWGNDDTSVLAALVGAVKSGRFMWMNGGHYLTSTTHVDNVCEGLILAAEKGKGGEAYFVTDGPPVELRTFISAMFATQGVDAGDKSVPHWVALTFGTVAEWVWDTFKLSGPPPLFRMAVRLFGEPVTVNDAKARRELGYVGKVTREVGLASLVRLPD